MKYEFSRFVLCYFEHLIVLYVLQVQIHGCEAGKPQYIYHTARSELGFPCIPLDSDYPKNVCDKHCRPHVHQLRVMCYIGPITHRILVHARCCYV